jgi:hypothetical protein
MANVSKWSNVAVAIQSALATAVPINSITKASPGVVGYTGTDPVNGDYLAVTANGMFQVDSRVYRAANVNGAGNTVELEGENTTAYDTFTSGSFQVVTFGTSITTLTGLQASGGDFDFIDVTTIHDNVRRQIPGISSPATFTFESLWDVSDAGLIALKQASDAQSKRAIRFTFSNGQKVVFLGYVGATLLPQGNAQDKVTTQVVITMDGRPTVLAT